MEPSVEPISGVKMEDASKRRENYLFLTMAVLFPTLQNAKPIQGASVTIGPTCVVINVKN